MLAQSLDKIGPDKIGLDKVGKKIGGKIGEKFMKYVQYFLDQSPKTKNLPLGY